MSKMLTVKRPTPFRCLLKGRTAQTLLNSKPVLMTAVSLNLNQTSLLKQKSKTLALILHQTAAHPKAIVPAISINKRRF